MSGNPPRINGLQASGPGGTGVVGHKPENHPWTGGGDGGRALDPPLPAVPQAQAVTPSPEPVVMLGSAVVGSTAGYPFHSAVTPSRDCMSRVVLGAFPHVCPGDGCAVCWWVSRRRWRRAMAEAMRDR